MRVNLSEGGGIWKTFTRGQHHSSLAHSRKRFLILTPRLTGDDAPTAGYDWPSSSLDTLGLCPGSGFARRYPLISPERSMIARLGNFAMPIRLRSPRVRIRTLILAVALVGLVMGWYVAKAKSRREAIAAIEKAGGWVEYADRFDGDTLSDRDDPPWPRWIRRVVGDEMLRGVRRVGLADAENEDNTEKREPRDWSAALEALGKLPEIRQLRMDPAGPGVFERIESLQGVEEVSFTQRKFPEDTRLAGLARLGNVRNLNLCYTWLTDSDLDWLAKMERLEVLDLSYNHDLSDAGMDHIARLTGLRSLSLGYTEVKAAGLAKLRSLVRLETFVMEHGGIDDADIAPLADLPRLRELGLETTWVRGTGLGGFRNLEVLNMRMSDADDAGLAVIGGLSRLRELDLRHTAVTAAGMTHLSHLALLERLDLEEQPVSGGLAALAGLSRLRWLNLAWTGVTDAELAHLAGLRGLRTLDLGRTAITDAGLAHLAHLSDLEELHLNGTAITGTGLAHLSGLANLRKLDLVDTPVTDAGLAHLPTLKNLEWLGLYLTQVTDPGLVQLAGRTRLGTLRLPKAITDAGLVHLRGLRSLKNLDLPHSMTTDAGIAGLREYLPDLKVD